eukprot:335045_1
MSSKLKREVTRDNVKRHLQSAQDRRAVEDLLIVKLQAHAQKITKLSADVILKRISDKNARSEISKIGTRILNGNDRNQVSSLLQELASMKNSNVQMLKINTPTVNNAVNRLSKQFFAENSGQETVHEGRTPSVASSRRSERRTDAAPVKYSPHKTRTSSRANTTMSSRLSRRSSTACSSIGEGSTTTSVVSSVSGAESWRADVFVSPSRLAKARQGQMDAILRDKINQRISGGNPCIRAFRFFDRSKKHRIIYKDFNEVVEELGLDMSPEEVEMLFNRYDVSKNGFISFEDFQMTLMLTVQQPGPSEWSEETLLDKPKTVIQPLGSFVDARDLFRSKIQQRACDKFQLLKAFRQFVPGQAKEIDEDAFSRTCSAIGLNLADVDMKDLFNKFANDDTNMIRLESLVDYLLCTHQVEYDILGDDSANVFTSGPIT